MDVRVEYRSTAVIQPWRKTPPCALIIFGAGSDLTKRLLIPTVYNLAKAKLLPERFAIIAVDRTPKPVNIWLKGSEVSSRIRHPGPYPNHSIREPGNSSRAASPISPAT